MAKPIMIQGTMSNAGKSLIAAGLCRIFRQDGYRVAPFKSQNMALNSFITEEGLEIGRAQAVQSQAAGISPRAAMNPILLKPSSDTGSQVIVMGEPVGTMPAREYFRYKKTLLPVIRNAYESLSKDYDIIVIEGAGSPAEINLKQDDIVNMGIARMAKAPVLLAGDIDRGGVFAQLYGTVMLLEEEERRYIKGLLINKFRGDRTILEPGAEMIEKLCGIPVTGIIPYIQADIEDEDSLSARLNAREKDEGAALDIAVIRFPRLSNFTDFQAFSCLPGVSVRYVEKMSELSAPDLIILPGTKNTIEDLLWMRQNGLEAAVLKAASSGVPVFGICGGYQMMGRSLTDEKGTEAGAPGVSVRGMGLLETATEFEKEKMRTRVTGRFGALPGIFSALSGREFSGYEIHMGRTRLLEGGRPLSVLRENQEGGETGEKPDGCVLTDEGGSLQACGTYVHGIFDEPGTAAVLAEALLSEKGMSLKDAADFDYRAYREKQFDLLADGLRKSLDMDEIYRILRQGI